MEGLAVFGICGFVFSLVSMSRIKRLERLLRENGIRSTGADSLANQLRTRIGETLTIVVYVDDESVGHRCRVLDVDEEWIRVLRNEGRKDQQEMLFRLCDVKQVKP